MLTGSVPFTGDTPLEIAMKHLSAIPEPPSEQRPEVPHELDSIVLRALAKDPRTATRPPRRWTPTSPAPRAARRSRPETEEAATQVLRGVGAATRSRRAPTEVVAAAGHRLPPQPPPPTARRPASTSTTSRCRRRSFWPWLLAALPGRGSGRRGLVRLHEDPGPAGRDEAGRRCRSSRASMERLRGPEASATPACRPHVIRAAERQRSTSATSSRQARPPGDAHRQGQPGRRSWSRPASRRWPCPGWSATRRPTRSRRSTERGLKADVHHINSDKETGHRHRPGPEGRARGCVKGDEGADQRLAGAEAGRRCRRSSACRTSRRPATLQGAGFAVARRDVESNDRRASSSQEDPPREQRSPRRARRSRCSSPRARRSRSCPT